MVNNSTVSTKMIRHRSPQIIEYKKNTIKDVGNRVPGSGQAHKM
jgi:hypothetical protein